MQFTGDGRLVVKGEDLKPKGRWFESQQKIPDIMFKKEEKNIQPNGSHEKNTIFNIVYMRYAI